MNQAQQKRCLKGGQHSNRLIEALCLQQQCKNDRLLCFYCIHQKHENHSIVYLLEGLNSQIEKININSNIENVEKHKNFVEKKVRKINHGWKSLYKLFQQHVHSIETHLQPQITAIKSSFDKNAVNQIIQIITRQNTTKQQIQKQVARIKLITKYDLSDINKLKMSAQIVSERLKQIYKQANLEVTKIMHKIIKQANLLDQLNQISQQAHFLKPKILQIDPQSQIQVCISKDIYKQALKSQKNNKFSPRRQQNRYIEKRNQILNSSFQKKVKFHLPQEKQSFQEQKKQISKRQVQMKQNIEQKNLNGHKKDKLSLVKSIQINNSLQNGHLQKNLSEKSSKKLFMNQKEVIDNSYTNFFIEKKEKALFNKQLVSQSEDQLFSSSYEIISNSQNQESDKSLNKIQLNKIYIEGSSLIEIQKKLAKIPQQNYGLIQEVQIYCDTLTSAISSNIVNFITKFKNLIKLIICQAHYTNKQDLTKLIKSFPSLQYLVLEQNYSLDNKIVASIVKDMKKLRKFHYTSDSLNNLRFKQENTQFMIEVDGSTKYSIIKQLLKLKDLQTIVFEIDSGNNQNENIIKKKLQRIKKLKQVSVIFHQKQMYANKILTVLSRRGKDLLHLELKLCYFKEDAFIQVLENIQTLKSLVINKCRHITDQSIQVLKKHKKYLKQIDFLEQDQITGEGFEVFPQLEHLGIKACWKINQQIFGRSISKLHKLKSLNLNLNRFWLTDKMAFYIKQLKNLELLAVDHNIIHYKSLEQIITLKNLKTLICGNTELDEGDIVKFLKNTNSKIKKLSLKRQVFQDKSHQKQINNQSLHGKILISIGQNAPDITHLNIKGMKDVRIQYLQKIKKLRCLSTDNGQIDSQTLTYLKEKQVALYIDYNYYDYNQPLEEQEQQISLEIKEPRKKIPKYS